MRRLSKFVAATKIGGYDQLGYEVFYISFGSGIIVNEGTTAFWKSLCGRLHVIYGDRFTFNKNEDTTSDTFVSFFSKITDRTRKPVILIIDEASKMVDGDKTYNIVTDFISTLRDLRDNNINFCLHALALIGTESVREFLLGQQNPNSQSPISPFSAEASFESTRFTEADVTSLLRAYADDSGLKFDLFEISRDIYDRTLGHKGLVGLCCYYLESVVADGKNNISIQDWNLHTPLELSNFIIGKATYARITYALKELSRKQRHILGNVLRYGTFTFSKVGQAVFILAMMSIQY